MDGPTAFDLSPAGLSADRVRRVQLRPLRRLVVTAGGGQAVVPTNLSGQSCGFALPQDLDVAPARSGLDG